MSALYAHPSFPEYGVDHAFDDVKKNMCKHFARLLRPSNVYEVMLVHCDVTLRRFVLKKIVWILFRKAIVGKHENGRAITFTDFFGHLVGEHLLGSEVSLQIKV